MLLRACSVHGKQTTISSTLNIALLFTSLFSKDHMQFRMQNVFVCSQTTFSLILTVSFS